jgi:predicted short-subunit dehydrogenase-like oxidoreductase (DUF2520 family)
MGRAGDVPPVSTLRVIGRGRAGGSVARALVRAGWEELEPVGRDDEVRRAAAGADLLVIATPDDVIGDVAGSVEPRADTVVAHLAGSLGLGVLDGHRRPAALHPLVSLPSSEIGARRLAAGAWFAVAGDPLVDRVVADLGGRSFTVADDDRATYHAAACMAANHLVALFSQVERVAAAADVPFEAYLALGRDTLANVAELGPAAALTGPAARGDEATISRHREALPPAEHRAYDALAAEARRLAGRDPA